MKKEQRKHFIQKRRAFYDDRICDAVTQRVVALAEYNNAKNIFCYASYNFEVDTFSLMRRILADGKNLYLPRCIKETKEMEVCSVKNLDELETGSYGIKEPLGIGVSADIIDLVIVPMVAFDRNMTRLGYGGGYYDRFLEKTNAVKLGIAFSAQEAELVICEPTDIAMDIIVTEKEVIV